MSEMYLAVKTMGSVTICVNIQYDSVDINNHVQLNYKYYKKKVNVNNLINKLLTGPDNGTGCSVSMFILSLWTNTVYHITPI